ncbi:hypothetical protein MAR_035313 [Mya arenaria]|uniref:Uncharacterized protein n=1 Tax=Mya arenaria TaxID=6604 RepID=A0ABY7EJR2_MYAAR|nr:hypothetical protein MAR_035313 [Mya arenaria]
MTSLTFAMVVIVATFGIQSAFGFKDALIKFTRDTNLENNIVTLYNRDGKRGNVVVVEIRNKDDNSFTRINVVISVSKSMCLVSNTDAKQEDKQEGSCSELVRVPRDDVTREVDNECEGLDVYVERSKQCNAVSMVTCKKVYVWTCGVCSSNGFYFECCYYKEYLVCS